MHAATKTDEFSENFQTASDPREIRKFATKFIRIGVAPPFSETHRFYPAKITEKPQQNFLDRKFPPPFGNFPKIHPVCSTQASLNIIVPNG